MVKQRLCNAGENCSFIKFKIIVWRTRELLCIVFSVSITGTVQSCTSRQKLEEIADCGRRLLGDNQQELGGASEIIGTTLFSFCLVEFLRRAPR
ncbi:hypothetical protein OIU77_001711 [Salix suchowensis]|uniref:Uncharacterized protein n=1 Tax=Salix suchowensis TaxID=1278906 RepID=A0ABQ9B496_9ROSI|nr:hypothetical protein OIU77_001711 [Salix suchowensis]